MIVISSHPEEHLRKEAEEYGLEGHFLKFLGNMRDKSWGIMQARLGMSIKPAETLYIGDTIYDIKAAKGANAHSAGIASGYHVRERLQSENPDILVDTLTEFQSAIRELLRA